MTVVYLERKIVFGGVLIVAVAFVFGVVIGFFGKTSGNDLADAPAFERLVQDKFRDEQEMMQKVMDGVDTDKIKSYFEVLTKEPHIAALRRDKELVKWIQNEWKSAGLDHVELAEYDVYLSWPNQTNPNKIYLRDEDGNVRFTSKHKEKELREGDDHKDFIHAFNGYAPASDLDINLSDVVYTHFARVEDLQKLEEMGISLEGKICLARYGKIYRGNKVNNCQTRGAVGVILFSDPNDVAVNGTSPDKVYPNTFFLPGSGIQRGSTFLGEGDPLSPLYPSVENAYRTKPEDMPGLPKIPSQPIGYDDAKIILEKIGGSQPLDGWKGGIEGVGYNLGDSEHPDYRGWRIQLKTNNYFDTVKDANIIGYIKGEIEPDRYVMLSNHRDAWGYGAVDPSSGTAQLMEVVRSLGELHKSGWKPRRTIVFASWCAEEYSLAGSYEWVEDKLSKIMDRMVGVVNTDICVSGPIAKPQASPVLRDIVKEALQHASDPTSGKDYFPSPRSSKNYYDFWSKWYNQDNTGARKEPKIKLLGSGSDHAGFAFYAGVAAVNLRFKDDTKKHKGVGQYPTYHTGYETFYLVDQIIDPGYKIHRTCAQTSLHMLMNLADSLVLPYNLNHLAEEMANSVTKFETSGVEKLLEENGATLKHLRKAVQDFGSAAQEYMDKLKSMERNDPMELRMINDQLMQLERVFIIPSGLPGRPETRHSIFAPAKFDKYGASAFPGVSDLIHEIEKLRGDEKKERWEQVKKHTSDLMIIVQSATAYLMPTYLI